MPFERWSDQVLVAHLADDPQFSEDVEQAQATVKNDKVNLVLDFAAVHYVNSSNISQLLRLRKLTIATETRMILCSMSNQVWGAFLVTGLDKIFEVSDNVMTSLATLQLQ
jgi:anti-sigma B factor antagonist